MSTATAARAPARAPERSRPAGRPQLRLVERRQRRTRHQPRRSGLRLGITVTVVILFASLFGLAVFHTVLVQGQARLDRIDARVASQEARAQELRLQVAGLEAPSRIVAEARGRLGMVSPAEITYLMPAPTVPGPDSVVAGRAGLTARRSAKAKKSVVL